MTERRPRTTLVHGGTRRSQYGEVSEAIFLTQGFVYASAAEAEARFRDSGPDEFIYARYGNPTVRMFEERMALLEGAEDAFATASGMAAVSGALTSALAAGDRVVAARALFGSCLYVLDTVLGRFGVEVELVDGTDPAAWEAAIRPGHEGRVPRVDLEPHARGHRHPPRRPPGARRRRAADGGQRVRHARAHAGLRPRRRRGDLLGHQARGRAGARPGRRDPRHAATSSAAPWSPT